MKRRTVHRVAMAALTAFAAMLAAAVSTADLAMAAELPHEAESMTSGIMSSDGTIWPKPISGPHRKRQQGRSRWPERHRRENRHDRPR